MSSDYNLEELWIGLTKKFEVDDFFYATFDLAVLPSGHITDIENSVLILKAEGLPITVENIYRVMELKRELFLDLQKDERMLKEIEDMSRGSVGWGGVPPPYDLVSLLALAILVWHFSKSFFERSGQLLAEKLFGHLEAKTERKLSDKERNILAVSCENFIQIRGEKVQMVLNRIEREED